MCAVCSVHLGSCPNLSMKPSVSLKTGRMMTKEILFMKPGIVRTAVIMNSSIFLVHSGLFGPLLSGVPWIVEARQGSLFVIPELEYICTFFFKISNLLKKCCAALAPLKDILLFYDETKRTFGCTSKISPLLGKSIFVFISL